MKRLTIVALAAGVLVGCEGCTEPEIVEPEIVETVNDPSCIAPPAGIVSWWPAEGDALDVGGLNDASLRNGSTYAPGKVGQAFSLDADDDVVGAGADSVGTLKKLTVEMWVRLNELRSAEQRFVTLGNEKLVLRAYEGDPELVMRIDGVFVSIVVDDALQAGVFHHVAATHDGTTMKLFVDGVQVTAAFAAGTVQTTDFLHFSGPGTGLGGLIDEITIYDHALSPAEIQSIFAIGSAGKCKP